MTASWGYAGLTYHASGWLIANVAERREARLRLERASRASRRLPSSGADSRRYRRGAADPRGRTPFWPDEGTGPAQIGRSRNRFGSHR